MAYEPEKDVELASQIIPADAEKADAIIARVCQYDGGQPKVALNTIYKNDQEQDRFGKMRRMTVNEWNQVQAAMESMLEGMVGDMRQGGQADEQEAPF